MALEVTNLKRVFKFKKGNQVINLVDPGAELSVEEVIQRYSAEHSELTTCTIDGPKIDGDQAIYEFKTTVGTKG
jgi:PRTRC genetic system protein C